MTATATATPLVSVCMITYNHARYIAQAIESVLIQRTSFPIELLIGDDNSTDGTRAIVQSYAEQYPHIIRTFLHPHNLGPSNSPGKNNLVSLLQHASGQYIALLEGDDYWIDIDKLTKQVNFLNDNDDCVLCFHNVEMFIEGHEHEPHLRCQPGVKPKWTLEDILVTYPIHTSSVVFRNGIITQFPEWFYRTIMGDWPLYVLLARRGNFGYLDDVMSRYRIHSQGLYSSTPPFEWLKERLLAYDLVDEFLGFEYHGLIEEGKRWWVRTTFERFPNYAFTHLKVCDAYRVLRSNLSLYNQYIDSKINYVGQLLAMYMFRAWDSNDLHTVKSCMAKLLRHDVHWFLNRGVLSICMRTIVRTIIDFLRSKFSDIRAVVNRTML